MIDLEFKEPHEQFTFLEKSYSVWGSSSGRTSTDDYEKGKFNRYARLGKISDETLNDFISIINSDKESIDGRCAFASLIMMIYGVRIGNEGSAEGYESGLEKNKGEIVHTYGVTTLLKTHITINKNQLILNFLGKEQVQHNITISEPFLVKIGEYYHHQHTQDKSWIGIDYETLFKFIRSKVGKNFIPKDLRTFCGNITGWNAIEHYLTKPQKEKKSDVNKEVAEIVEIVAERLSNTPGIAKKSYIDNRMLDWFKHERLKETEND